MVTKSAKKTKKPLEPKAFIKEVKNGKYGTIEKTSIKYARMTTNAEPFESKSQSVTYYGLR